MNQHSGRIAAIDYGTVRLGIAVSDPGQSIASPYENYTRRDPQQDARHLKQMVAEEGIVGFVVGLPLHLDGRESQKSEESRQFGKWLADQTGIPVDFHDERFTSLEAEERMLAADMSRQKRKKRRDMLAAQLLLTAYLESDRDADSQSPGSLG
jgi:putative Holliday junction resolvase